MRILLIICTFLITSIAFGQSEQLAKSYFKSGDFEKALLSYQKLYDANKGNSNYFIKIIQIHQQLEQLDVSEQLLIEKIAKSQNPQYMVELGYNYQLKNQDDKAKEFYHNAKERIEEKPVFAYNVASTFEKHALIEHAAQVYERAMQLRPESNYNLQLARIYGEQGKVEKMFASYINFVEFNTSYITYAKRAFSEYISENKDDDYNQMLRQVLLKKIQSHPNILWNQMLSWLFVQQQDYGKAFAQEKAIHKRNQDLQGVSDLAYITLDEGELETATEIFTYIIQNTFDIEVVLEAHKNLLEIETQVANHHDLNSIEKKYQALFVQYGKQVQTINLQLSFGHFIAFHLNDPLAASDFLKNALETRLPRFQEAKIKLKLGDILVFQEKFNEALIYYSQIQKTLKNSTLSQEARFKVAKASYYKGDFKWAESQLKILKASTSQLIANDALDLKLLISDNKFEDSTQTALKIYAKADLYAYQNKSNEAIDLLEKILQNHKTETIVDQALLKQAQLFEKQKQFEKAAANYQRIIADFKEDILADDAYYALAEIYVNHLAQPEKAKELYEKIIFDHADSIYFVEARKKYRALRGDAIN